MGKYFNKQAVEYGFNLDDDIKAVMKTEDHLAQSKTKPKLNSKSKAITQGAVVGSLATLVPSFILSRIPRT